MIFGEYSDYGKAYARIAHILSPGIRQAESLDPSDPFSILIGFIALSSVIGSVYASKIIDNKYIRYPIIDPKSNINVLDNFGARPAPFVPSSITAVLEYTAGLSDSYIRIPSGTVFEVLGDEFVTFDEFYLLPNSTYASVTAYLGEIRDEEFGIADIVSQRIPLYYKNLCAEKVKVTVDGEDYNYVPHCRYRKGDHIFGIEYEYSDTFCIAFPENYADSILAYSRIHVKYLTADETINYDPTQEEVSLESPIYDGNGDNLAGNFEVYGIESFSYGDRRHTSDFCYRNLGKLLATFGKAVTTEDYKVLTDYYPGVAVSAAYDIASERRMDPLIYVQIPYYTKIVVAPTENYYPTEYLKKELYDYYDRVGVDRSQAFIQIIDPRYRNVDLDVMIQSDYMTQAEILDCYNLIYDSVRDFFRVGNLEFGSTITEDVLLSVVIGADTRLIYSEAVVFRNFQTVYCEADELPILGRLGITFSYRQVRQTDDFGITDYGTLERKYPERISSDDSQFEVGPYSQESIYFTDEIYRENTLANDITIIRYTNIATADFASYDILESQAEDRELFRLHDSADILPAGMRRVIEGSDTLGSAEERAGQLMTLSEGMAFLSSGYAEGRTVFARDRAVFGDTVYKEQQAYMPQTARTELDIQSAGQAALGFTAEQEGGTRHIRQSDGAGIAENSTSVYADGSEIRTIRTGDGLAFMG